MEKNNQSQSQTVTNTTNSQNESWKKQPLGPEKPTSKLETENSQKSGRESLVRIFLQNIATNLHFKEIPDDKVISIHGERLKEYKTESLLKIFDQVIANWKLPRYPSSLELEEFAAEYVRRRDEKKNTFPFSAKEAKRFINSLRGDQNPDCLKCLDFGFVSVGYKLKKPMTPQGRVEATYLDSMYREGFFENRDLTEEAKVWPAASLGRHIDVTKDWACFILRCMCPMGQSQDDSLPTTAAFLLD